MVKPTKALLESYDALSILNHAGQKNIRHMDSKLLTASPGLSVIDMAAAMAYYQRVLGFAVAYSNEASAVVERDGVSLHLALDRAGDKAGHGFCYLVVQGVDQLYQVCIANRANIVRPIEDSPYGMRDFNISDLDGNILLIGESIQR
jgi:uncharacterized glyoxalase superfamily protein PhnB